MMKKLILRPGINQQLSPTANEGGFSDASLVRFRDGFAQKQGGWQRIASGTYLGICRGLHPFRELAGNIDLAAGTNRRLYVYQGGTYYEVTPLRKTVNPMSNNPLATTNGSATVTVTDAGHGASAGDDVNLTGLSAVAGLTISGDYTIQTVLTANTYTITASGNANATTNGGGAAGIAKYFLATGPQDATAGLGWGAGSWGSGTWGTPRSVSAILLQPRVWALDNWGEDLLASPLDGALYLWDASVGTGTRAAVVATAPSLSKWMLVGLPERHAICFGTDTGGTQDPMLIRWSDTEDYTNFTTSSTNAAGSFRLAGGTTIVSARRTSREILVFTDKDVTSMVFRGLPYVYTFQPLGQACGLIAPQAAVVLNDICYWMSDDHFNYYDGTVHTLDCDLWGAIFNNINRDQAGKIVCGVNSSFNEITWWYPSASSTEIDSYVTFNIGSSKQPPCWYGGLAATAFARTAWVDREIFGAPIGADPTTQRLMFHEVGVDADGAAMSCFVETALADIDDGEEFSETSLLIPDMRATDGKSVMAGQLAVTLKTQNEPGGTIWEQELGSVSSTTVGLGARGRGRAVALRWTSSMVGDDWRLGVWRLRYSPDGRQGGA